MKEAPANRGPVRVGEYFNPLREVLYYSTFNPGTEGFFATQELRLGDGVVYLDISGHTVRFNPVAAVNFYPAFTPLYPEMGFILGKDGKTPLEQRDGMKDRAEKAYERDPSLSSDYEAFMSLKICSLYIGISAFISEQLADYDSVKRLRLRLEFPSNKDSAGSSFDAEPKIEEIGLRGSEECFGLVVNYNTFYPSEIPFPIHVPEIAEGLPIRIPDPDLFGLDTFKDLRAKLFYAGEGLLAEYDAAANPVSNPREFIPSTDADMQDPLA